MVQPSSVAWNSVLMETPDLHFLSCAAQPKCCYYPSQSGESHSPPYFESSLSLQAPLKGPISQHLLLQRRNRVSLIRCPLFLSLSFHPPSSLFHLSLFTYLFLSLSLHASLSLYITLSIYPSLPLSCLSFHPPTSLFHLSFFTYFSHSLYSSLSSYHSFSISLFLSPIPYFTSILLSLSLSLPPSLTAL